ncbi:MAG: fluoride efflux transporter CrcB [Paracoccaceae bacterium]
MIWTLSQVALGGAIGAVLRHLTSLGALRVFGAGFPCGTLAVNVVGSFVMGALFVALAQKDALRLAPFLMTGILGGFTTFSAFSLDAFRLWEDGQAGLASGYVLGSVALSIAALVAGVLTMRGMLA